MRVFKLRIFTKFQRRERIADASLLNAIKLAEQGLVDADLGGGLIKQRIARPGKGKSGGYRTLIAFWHGERAVFLYGFAKSERDNIDDEELDRLRVLARHFIAMEPWRISELVENNELMEIADVTKH